MSLSRKISARLFEEAEKKRKLKNLPFHIQKIKLREHPTENRRSSWFIAVVVLMVLAVVGIIQQKERFKETSLCHICLPTTGIIVGFWVLLNKMESENVNYSTRNLCKTFITKFFKSAKKNLTKVEELYLSMKNISVLINQLVFFCLCEQVMALHQPLVALYTLLFLNVIAYCVTYIKELIEKEDWTMFVTISRTSNVRHLALSTTKIVLEWTKAITFIITIVFMLLIIFLEKGLKNYSPTIPYLIVTALYFVISEKVFVDLILKLFDHLKFGCFENMESLYLPIILKAIQIAFSATFIVICYSFGLYRMSILSSLTNVRLRYKELDTCHWKTLKQELEKLKDYQYANKEDIARHDDVCAICLSIMKTARVTPCNHFFHADCLLKSISTMSRSCPICKQQLPSST